MLLYIAVVGDNTVGVVADAADIGKGVGAVAVVISDL